MSLRSRIVFALASALASVSAYAQWWNSSDPTPPKDRGTPAAPKVVYDRRLKDLAFSEANVALLTGNFEKVDRMYDEFAANGGLRTTDGGFMVDAFQQLFENRCDYTDEAAMRAELSNWAKARPDSHLRPAVEVITLQCQAWKARGNGNIGTVSDESGQIFKQKLLAAAKVIGETEAAGKDSPLWWWGALIVAGSSGMPGKNFDAMFAEATRRFPSYQPLYYTRANYYLPQWGGSFEALEKFAERSAASTSDKEGQAMYAWIYTDLAKKRVDIFEDSQVSWPHLKKAFEDMIARHPDVWNKNLFATFACRARDKETTGRLLIELGDKAKLGAWSNGITTETCRRFATTDA